VLADWRDDHGIDDVEMVVLLENARDIVAGVVLGGPEEDEL